MGFIAVSLNVDEYLDSTEGTHLFWRYNNLHMTITMYSNVYHPKVSDGGPQNTLLKDPPRLFVNK